MYTHVFLRFGGGVVCFVALSTVTEKETEKWQ